MERVGRGGAGNYKPAQKDEQAQACTGIEPDLEAAAPSTLTAMTSREPAPDSVVKTGRGGAGNWSTHEQQARSEFEASVKSNARGTATLQSAEAPPPPRRGRGGAGNYTASYDDADSEAKRKAEEQKVRREEITRAVVEDVEKALPMPAAAHLGGKKKVESS